ncbi:MAG: hypothetical protein QOI41_5562 [Myxococcales bacterium]|nr:hypothetical protein [Myxococcales bacterium]
MFARAELHGVAGVIWDAWKGHDVPVERDLETKLEARVLAREMDHDAHLALLRRIDAVLTVPTVALKGPLFAARYYGRPSARGTTDIDLLVAETDIERAIGELSGLGYSVADTAKQIKWALRAHHHLHLVNAGAPDLELHFHAYRGFGVTLTTQLLAERSVAAAGLRTIRVPSAEDELVYLAVHAAAHRFGRLAWLHDLRLVVERMTPAALEAAAARARTWGVSRALALAGEMLVDVLGVNPEIVRPLGSLSSKRGVLVHAVVGEPRTRMMRAATRMAYAIMLADSVTASARYATTYSVERARQLLDLG